MLGCDCFSLLHVSSDVQLVLQVMTWQVRRFELHGHVTAGVALHRETFCLMFDLQASLGPECVLGTNLLNGSRTEAVYDGCTIEGVHGGSPVPMTVPNLYPLPQDRCISIADCGKQTTHWTCDAPTTPVCTCYSADNWDCLQVNFCLLVPLYKLALNSVLHLR